MPNRVTPLHRSPRVYPLSVNAITSLQLLNILLLAWWTYQLILHHDAWQRVPQMDALRLFGHVYWWAWVTGVTLIISVLPLVPWWARHVNRTYILKRVGLVVSAMWWAFLAAVFWHVGSDLGIGIHAALAFACLFEVMRLVRFR